MRHYYRIILIAIIVALFAEADTLAQGIGIGIGVDNIRAKAGGPSAVIGNLLLVGGGNILLVGGGKLQCLGPC